MKKASKSIFNFFNLFYVLLVFVPLLIFFKYLFPIDNTILFALSVLALIPLAKIVGDTTEHLGEHFGVTGGSLINVTFSNMPEIILSTIAIQSGLFDLVKANITGFILGEILLVLGLSLIAGGLRCKEQIFNKENIVFHTSILFLAIIIISIPTIVVTGNLFSDNVIDTNKNTITILSNSFAFILITVYIFGLIFTFKTHKHLFVTDTIEKSILDDRKTTMSLEKEIRTNEKLWSNKKSVGLLGLLAASMIGVAIISEILVGAVEQTIEQFQLSILFVGAIIIGIAGNVPEHTTSILLARRGKLDLSIGIAASSGSQIALFVLPVIVIAAMIMGIPFHMTFTSFELITIFASVIMINIITFSGKSNWFYGIMLVALYVAIAIGFSL